MNDKRKRSWWGIGSVALYLGFVVFVLALVLFASVQDFQLTGNEYYKAGLNYQVRIDCIKRSQALAKPLDIDHRLAENRIVLTFPSVAAGDRVGGEIRMLRASNARLDQSWQVATDADGLQTISTNGMARGNWRIEVEWQADSLGYFDEKQIVIP